METRRSAASTLARLAEQKADRFDPARFCYIVALVRRSAKKQPAVRRRLEEKALAAVSDYQKRFEAARQAAADHAARLAEKHPDQADQLRKCIDQCDFNGVRRMADRIARNRGRRLLTGLTDQIAMAGRLANENAEQISLDALLQRQEEEIVASFGISLDGQSETAPMPNARLRAFHFFQKNWVNHHADTVVNHAINHIPDNPGHLNSQMLVTRCLAAMRNVAPAYLRRWVSYMETLLWMEEAGREDPSRATKVRPQT